LGKALSKSGQTASQGTSTGMVNHFQSVVMTVLAINKSKSGTEAWADPCPLGWASKCARNEKCNASQQNG